VKRVFWSLWVVTIACCLALLVTSCGTWQETAGKTLSGVSVLAKEMSAKAEPGYRAKCQKVAKTCSGLPCAQLEVCQHERDRVNSAIKALHRAVRAGAEVIPLIGDVSSAAGGK
jgi:hypothetical protein